jgi:hypothetical protein
LPSQSPPPSRRLGAWLDGVSEEVQRVSGVLVAGERTRPVLCQGGEAESAGRHQGAKAMVGVSGFEPPTSRSRTVRSSQAELHPDARV